jgi:hypothetical protein
MPASRSKSTRRTARKTATAKRSTRPTAAARRGTATKAVRAAKAVTSQTSIERVRKVAERTVDRATNTVKRAKAAATQVARDVSTAIRGTDNRKKAGVAAAVLGVTVAAAALTAKGRR